MKNKFLILGASAAGISAITKIRQSDKESEIVLIAPEKDVPYNKCFLVDYIADSKNRDQLYIRKKDFFKQNNVKLMLGKKAIQLNSKNKIVILDDLTEVNFDKLLISFGVQPFIPKVFLDSGFLNKGVFAFNTLNDTDQIYNYVKTNGSKKVVVVGAGLTGIEVADALQKKGLEVCVVDIGKKILPHHTDSYGSNFVKSCAQNLGIKFYMNCYVDSLSKVDDEFKLNLSNNKLIESDLIVVATGAKINTQFFENACIKLDYHGVIVDDFLQTNQKDIFVAGDIISIYDQVSQNQVRSCTWPDAVMQGMISGSNIAGVNKKYPGAMVVAVSNFFGKDFISSGILSETNGCSALEISKNGSYYLVNLNSEGQIVGFLQVGEVKNLTNLKGSVASQKKLAFSEVSSWFK